MELKNNLSRIINASGKMTVLGGSVLSERAAQALKEGSQTFYLMEELLKESSQFLAKRIGVEAAHIVSSASSGIAQSVGAAIAQDNRQFIMNVYSDKIIKNEIVIAKGHIVNYGTSIEVPIRMGGGKIVEAGYANECSIDDYAQMINKNTAAILYVVSHHAVQKSMASVNDVIELAHHHQIPIIIDAAAEGNLKMYAHKGADAVIYSGTKAIEGPTSGLIVGKKDFIEFIRLQGLGIGRVMKVGKEALFSLTNAIDEYLDKEPESIESQKNRLQTFNQYFEGSEYVACKIVQDGAGRPIFRSELTFTPAALARSIVTQMQTGNNKIYTRDYRQNEGIIEIDIRDVNDDELKEIYKRIDKEIQECIKV
ncbi:DgaE family pyridoxal phosphate-dependent ammonia lyase [Erysipelothrix urinaevulpis]|uniref:DgaE family pyridoxal phosphate-dependent ammonia lyase n=1 Tax=Erysipelothrix urinaevulpis TaxID=2683717 RepID=UPI00135765B5|nr:DgaE family pyridoxal phosphate-dependent ammonia lyase [Erysipelothrix urinaevulpis]